MCFGEIYIHNKSSISLKTKFYNNLIIKSNIYDFSFLGDGTTLPWPRSPVWIHYYWMFLNGQVLQWTLALRTCRTSTMPALRLKCKQSFFLVMVHLWHESLKVKCITLSEYLCIIHHNVLYCCSFSCLITPLQIWILPQWISRIFIWKQHYL